MFKGEDKVIVQNAKAAQSPGHQRNRVQTKKSLKTRVIAGSGRHVKAFSYLSQHTFLHVPF